MCHSVSKGGGGSFEAMALKSHLDKRALTIVILETSTLEEAWSETTFQADAYFPLRTSWNLALATTSRFVPHRICILVLDKDARYSSAWNLQHNLPSHHEPPPPSFWAKDWFPSSWAWGVKVASLKAVFQVPCSWKSFSAKRSFFYLQCPPGFVVSHRTTCHAG